MTQTAYAQGGEVRRRSGPSGYEHSDGQCRTLRPFSRPLDILLPGYVVVSGLFILAVLFGAFDHRVFLADNLSGLSFETDRFLTLMVWAFILLTLLERLAFYVCAFFVARLTYRAMKNLYTVRSIVPDMSPVGTFLWYGVPFANLVKPSQGMHEIYKGSLYEAGTPAPDGRVSRWWAAWLVSIIASLVAGFSGLPLEIGIASMLVSLVAGIVAALLLRNLVREIAEAQQAMLLGGKASVFD